MQRIKLHANFELSRLVHGHWRLSEWKLTDQQLLKLTEQTIELGITSFDHADIYGDYECESIFGRALKLQAGLREKIEIVTKCGIKLISDKFLDRSIKHYDYSFDHIVGSVERSLSNLSTDYIDILLLHRPSPFFSPEDVAKAFDMMHQQGKVRYFGVSNFTPSQYKMLQAHCDQTLVTNQLEISPYCIDSFQDGSMDLLQQLNIKPMAWSPLAGGRIFSPSDDQGHRVLGALQKVAGELEASVAQVIYSWILTHPAQILPVIGSGKLTRIEEATKGLNLKLSLEHWFEIFGASLGQALP